MNLDLRFDFDKYPKSHLQNVLGTWYSILTTQISNLKTKKRETQDDFITFRSHVFCLLFHV